MESVTWVQILDEVVCISLFTNALEEGMNPSMNIWINTFPKCISTVKCKQPCLEFELWWPFPFPTTLTIKQEVPLAVVKY